MSPPVSPDGTRTYRCEVEVTIRVRLDVIVDEDQGGDDVEDYVERLAADLAIERAFHDHDLDVDAHVWSADLVTPAGSP